MRALSIAATGMAAQSLNVEVIANNIANSNTTAFKRSQAQFPTSSIRPSGRPAFPAKATAAANSRKLAGRARRAARCDQRR